MPSWRFEIPAFTELSWYGGPRTWTAPVTPALCIKAGHKAIGRGFYGMVILDVDPGTGKRIFREVAEVADSETLEAAQNAAYEAATAYLETLIVAFGGVRAPSGEAT